MRIAHITATFPPYFGGTGGVCLGNARELARRGHCVHVYTAAVRGTPAKEERDGFKVTRLSPVLRVGNAAILPQLLGSLRGYDLIHLHYPFFGGELTALASWLSSTPMVITYHQDVILSGWMGMVEVILRHTVERWVLSRANRILFTSLDYSRTSNMLPLLKGREGAIGELPNGTDIVSFSLGNPSRELRQSFDLKAQDQVVLLVASLDQAHWFKGVSILLKALSELPSSIKAIIVGDGSLRSTYGTEAKVLGVDSRVFFPGFVIARDLPDYYRLANVTVLPSLTRGEAFGLVLLESMACGTPVIASNLPGVRTLVEDGINGYLVEPGDVGDLVTKLAHILSLPDSHRQTMGTAGRHNVEMNYAWERIGDRLETLYQLVVAETAMNSLVEQKVKR